jgi:photosystem I subunit XI
MAKPAAKKAPMSMVSAYNNDPFVGHLSTPISDSAVVRDFLAKLAINRPGLQPVQRGFEIGLAHGYLVFGPMANLGPNRAAELANAYGFFAAASLIGIGTTCLIAYGKVTFDSKTKSKNPLQTAAGWADFAKGFNFGGLSGAMFACMVLEAMRFFA